MWAYQLLWGLRLAAWAIVRVLALPLIALQKRGTLRLIVLLPPAENPTPADQARQNAQGQALAEHATGYLAQHCKLTVHVAWHEVSRIAPFPCEAHGFAHPAFWQAERAAARAVRQHRAHLAVLLLPRLIGNTTGCYMPGASFVAVDMRAGPEVLAHELGHAAGLFHNKAAGNLMSAGTQRQGTHLTKWQRRLLATIPYRFFF